MQCGLELGFGFGLGSGHLCHAVRREGCTACSPLTGQAEAASRLARWWRSARVRYHFARRGLPSQVAASAARHERLVAMRLHIATLQQDGVLSDGVAAQLCVLCAKAEGKGSADVEVAPPH